MNTATTLKLARLTLGALLLSGCYTTTVSSGKPAAQAGIEYDEKWHHGVAWGMAELSGPYNLEQVCPAGWSEIKTETSFANGFVNAVSYGIYSPQTVTVRCAASAPAVARPAPASAPAAVPPAAASPSTPATPASPSSEALPPPPRAPGD